MTCHKLLALPMIAIMLFGFLAACGGSSSSSDQSSPSLIQQIRQQYNLSDSLPLYFIDSANGSDNASGTDPEIPWRSLGKLQDINGAFAVGLHKGSIWNDGITITADDVLVFSYGNGEQPQLNGYEQLNNWEAVSENIYKTAIIATVENQGSGHISSAEGILTFLPWLNSIDTTFASAAANSFSIDFAEGYAYVKLASAPLENEYVASALNIGIKASGQNIEIHDLQIKGFSLHGIQFEDCIKCRVQNVTINGIGGTSITTPGVNGEAYLYAGNGIEFANHNENSHVENIKISNIFDSCISPQTFGGNNRVLSGVTMKDMNLSHCGFAGVEISVLGVGGTTGSHISNITIENAQITDVGRGWSGQRYGSEGYGIRAQADSGAGTIDEVEISDVEISNSINGAILLHGQVQTARIERNWLEDNAYAVAVGGNEASDDIEILSSAFINNRGDAISINSPETENIQIYQNSFVDNQGINLAIYNAKTTSIKALNNLFSGGQGAHIFVSGNQLNTLNHNCYKSGVTNLAGINGAAYSTLSALNAGTAFDDNSIETVETGEVTDLTENSIQLNENSPCRGIGSDSVLGTLSLDYLLRPLQIPIDAGAVQYQD